MLDPILEKFGDHGAESSRRDEFQKHYAAHWCIEMFFDNTIDRVICEYGEDVIIVRDGKHELHQVKTRQESMDDWKVTDLLPIIAKSFAMVPYFENVTKCCFISNEKASGKLYDLKCILEKNSVEWTQTEEVFFEDFCNENAAKILKRMKELDNDNQETFDDVKSRLLMLDIDTDFHHLEYIQDSNIRRLRQVIETTNDRPEIVLTDAEIEDVYERVMGVVGKSTIAKNKQDKTLTKENIKICLSIPIKRRLQYRLPTQEEINTAPGQGKLQQKLGLGGFTPEFIDSARELHVATLYKARSWEFGDASSTVEDIRIRMKYTCSDSFDKICQANPEEEKIGRLILEEVKKEIPKLISFYEKSIFPVDDLFLYGTIWALTSECKAYWSQRRVG